MQLPLPATTPLPSVPILFVFPELLANQHTRSNSQAQWGLSPDEASTSGDSIPGRLGFFRLKRDNHRSGWQITLPVEPNDGLGGSHWRNHGHRRAVRTTERRESSESDEDALP